MIAAEHRSAIDTHRASRPFDRRILAVAPEEERDAVALALQARLGVQGGLTVGMTCQTITRSRTIRRDEE